MPTSKLSATPAVFVRRRADLVHTPVDLLVHTSAELVIHTSTDLVYIPPSSSSIRAPSYLFSRTPTSSAGGPRRSHNCRPHRPQEPNIVHTYDADPVVHPRNDFVETRVPTSSCTRAPSSSSTRALSSSFTHAELVHSIADLVLPHAHVVDRRADLVYPRRQPRPHARRRAPLPYERRRFAARAGG
ncbi:hypothetical protein BD626DRAFT_519833 [Schizophyllum amplum]|uniref:Uncharacterized protein n=1 Tax=Schizophyllum amplum TaxID=97359 RepID=A0A550BUW9_9AGAR|nr:hypothetical protein BD626DRAFT_519833 [Auriculariopsis ampla]